MRSGKPNPTGTGRYCLPSPGTCHCGGCAWWKPLPEIDWSRIEGSAEWQRIHGRAGRTTGRKRGTR